jgi:hypothetical protein
VRSDSRLGEDQQRFAQREDERQPIDVEVDRLPARLPSRQVDDGCDERLHHPSSDSARR